MATKTAKPTTEEQPVKNLTVNLPGRPRGKGHIDLSKAIELRMKNLSYEEIGAYFGVTRQAAHDKLRPYFGADIDVAAFKGHRADILAAKQAEVLAALDSDKIEKASARDIAIVFGTLYDKERLERGQSTQNASVFFRIIEQACDSEPVVIADNTTDSERGSGK
jgi:hypothetical protein